MTQTMTLPAPPDAMPHGPVAETFAISIPAGRASAGLMFFSASPVTGAPYSAEMTTATVQTLTDGNQIQHTTKASVYRDKQGRLRTEQTLPEPFGHSPEPGDSPKFITIQDFVSGNSYFLDPTQKVAQRAPAPQTKRIAELSKTKEVSSEAIEGVAVGGRVAGMAMPAGVAMSAGHVMNNSEITSAKTDLGTQIIEGIPAKGTKMTTTFATESIGNTLPIEVTEESWYSPDLHTIVMSKNSDPRIGVTTYRLTNINRSEPPASLFQVPADYTIKDDIGPGVFGYRKASPNGNPE
ncbi:MAG TPA: hypothetical protein VK604_24910 [Bryobacteraceae bacterium]|nr:hypothetical protein [Bryobacteraceae bacterium]